MDDTRTSPMVKWREVNKNSMNFKSSTLFVISLNDLPKSDNKNKIKKNKNKKVTGNPLARNTVFVSSLTQTQIMN